MLPSGHVGVVDGLAELGWDARARVAHPQSDFGSVANWSCGHVDHATRWGGLQGVADQIDDDLGGLISISRGEQRAAGQRAQAHAAFKGLLSE